MLKLPTRELPTVSFRRELPDYLGPKPKGKKKPEKCFISFEARAAGAINPKYQLAVEQIARKHRIHERRIKKIIDDETHVDRDIEGAKEVNIGRLMAIYDACVIDWSSNIQTETEDGETVSITCDRETFKELCSVRVPEIGIAITEFEAACLAAGREENNDDDELTKN